MVNALTSSANVSTVATKIELLPDEVIDQIAAGEVIERPASVLRELIDNALDAETRRIIVEFDGGGIESLMVLDDGIGMHPEDARRSLERHATSKIRNLADLEQLTSRGFRGEALASIAAVSRLTLTTREHDTDIATRIECEASKVLTSGHSAGQPGTRVDVRDLFFNIPARRKFLKSTPTETAHINKVFARAALSRPDVRFELRRAGHRTRLYAAGSPAQRAEQVFGAVMLAALAPEPIDGIAVSAHLAPPEKARTGTAHLHIFVNGRPVLDKALARSVAFAYGSVIPPGRYPVGCVYLKIDPTTVDINVHPQKLEVRFSDARRVHEATTRALSQALGTQPWERQTSAYRAGNRPQPKGREQQYPPNSDVWASLAILRDASAPADLPRQATPGSQDTGPFSSLRPIAQTRALFIVCEGDDGLYVIDQHAADERIRYAKLKRELSGQQITGQQLLFPAQIDVGQEVLAWLDGNPNALSQLGIDADRISETELLVRALPAIVANGDPALLVEQAMAELMRTSGRAWSDTIDTALATLACHSALRRGDRISLRECGALLAQLDATEEFAEHCPHGRPIVFRISYADLEKKLGR